jgi:hypothetical protein
VTFDLYTVTVALNRDDSSGGGAAGGKSGKMSSVELFSLKSKADFDTSVPMNESSKKAWLTAIFTVPGAGGVGAINDGSQSSKGMVLKSQKSTRQIQVAPQVQSSQKSAQSGTIEAVGSGSGKPSNELAIQLGAGSSRPRRNSLDKEAGVGIAESRKRGGRDSGKEEVQVAVPSGRIKNSALTRDAIGKIDQVSPIDAWQNQPAPSESRKGKPSAAVSVGLAAVTASSKYQLGGAGAGAGATGGGAAGGASLKVDTGAGIASAGKSMKNKHYSPVEAFESSGFSGRCSV